MTFSSGQYSSQIDFVLTRRDKRTCVDCKVIPRECVVAQHKLVVADFRFLVQARGNKQVRVARMKWWKLEGEASKVFKEKVIEEVLGMMKAMQTTCGRRWQHAFRRLLQRWLE